MNDTRSNEQIVAEATTRFWDGLRDKPHAVPDEIEYAQAHEVVEALTAAGRLAPAPSDLGDLIRSEAAIADRPGQMVRLERIAARVDALVARA